jgi:hypothetical protein
MAIHVKMVGGGGGAVATNSGSAGNPLMLQWRDVTARLWAGASKRALSSTGDFQSTLRGIGANVSIGADMPRLPEVKCPKCNETMGQTDLSSAVWTARRYEDCLRECESCDGNDVKPPDYRGWRNYLDASWVDWRKEDSH